MWLLSILQKLRWYLIITHQQGGVRKGCRGITSVFTVCQCLFESYAWYC